MSDLEKQIEQWRADLVGSDILDSGDIRELESHLRDEIDHLKSLSSSEDEAFWVARHRLGDAAALEREFAKLTPHQWLIRRLCWAITGVLLYLAATEFGGAMFYLFLKLGHMAGLRPVALGLVGSAVGIASFAGPILLVVWLYLRRSNRRTDGQVRGSKAGPILAATALVLGTWVFFVAGRLLAILFVRTPGTVELTDWKVQFGGALLAAEYVRLAGHFVVPVLLAGSLVVLYRRSRREVRAT